MTREEKEKAINALKVSVPFYATTHEEYIDYRQTLNKVMDWLEQEPNTWSLDDAREDFMHDVYNTLDFLPTNEEANQIIDSFDRVTSSIKQEPIDYKTQYENYLKKSEVVISQLRADRDRLQDAFDKIRAEIEQITSRY